MLFSTCHLGNWFKIRPTKSGSPDLYWNAISRQTDQNLVSQKGETVNSLFITKLSAANCTLMGSQKLGQAYSRNVFQAFLIVGQKVNSEWRLLNYSKKQIVKKMEKIKSFVKMIFIR